ncbi:Zn-dependent oxidoreductase [Capsulimonas corticalis]|uniref:Zn-dependent oxidoreductase n=1 Tax=Capsulimonas corticalis TaxID=2219043 RepID=A0A402CQ91_9BACT|nr:alcohol dehydrogenase catalytic domain-containing protein [Capsulimonas corticalis]BDI32794.1 Zn-dependent oxidoreductase [Capsulimonas corticalis]
MNAIPQEVTVPHFVGGGRIVTTAKPVPQPGAGQLLIEVKANALCGSERGQFRDGTPVTPGHEAAGVVAAAGPGATTRVGTPGAIFLMDFCGECRSCALGHTNQCLAKRGDMGFNRDGGYGVYELVHESLFFPTPSDVTPTEATLLLDIMGTGGHAIRRASLVHKDIQSVLIPGAGPIGLGLLAMVKLMLGKDIPVVLSDVVPYRLELAEKMGGLPVLATEMSLAEGMKRHGLELPDVVFDAAGQERVRDESMALLAHRGVLVSVAHGGGLTIKNLYADFVFREMTLIGSEYFSYNELPGNLELLRAHRDYLNQIITHRFGVGEIQHAFELFFEGNTGKVIIEQ